MNAKRVLISLWGTRPWNIVLGYVVVYALTLGLGVLSSLYEIVFLPGLASFWRIVLYLTIIAYPCFVMPVCLFKFWREDVHGLKRRKILNTLALILLLIPWGYVSFLSLFVVSFGDVFTVSVDRVFCTSSSQVYYLRQGMYWDKDDDGSSPNRSLTLYRRRGIFLQERAGAAIRTDDRGGAWYPKTDIDNPSTIIPLTWADRSVTSSYAYAPALKRLFCDWVP